MKDKVRKVVEEVFIEVYNSSPFTADRICCNDAYLKNFRDAVMERLGIDGMGKTAWMLMNLRKQGRLSTKGRVKGKKNEENSSV